MTGSPVVLPTKSPETSSTRNRRVTVTARIEAQSRPSFWSVFLEPAFGRRLMYASMTLVVLLGTYLISSESSEPLAVATTAEQYLVEENPAVGANPQQDRDAVLVGLATYNE